MTLVREEMASLFLDARRDSEETRPMLSRGHPDCRCLRTSESSERKDDGPSDGWSGGRRGAGLPMKLKAFAALVSRPSQPTAFGTKPKSDRFANLQKEARTDRMRTADCPRTEDSAGLGRKRYELTQWKGDRASEDREKRGEPATNLGK